MFARQISKLLVPKAIFLYTTFETEKSFILRTLLASSCVPTVSLYITLRNTNVLPTVLIKSVFNTLLVTFSST